MKHTFQEWVYKDPTRRRELERIYNDQFNCLVPRQYDGSHLTFPGMNPGDFICLCLSSLRFSIVFVLFFSRFRVTIGFLRRLYSVG